VTAGIGSIDPSPKQAFNKKCKSTLIPHFTLFTAKNGTANFGGGHADFNDRNGHSGILKGRQNLPAIAKRAARWHSYAPFTFRG
jgi:hypothetical protein